MHFNKISMNKIVLRLFLTSKHKKRPRKQDILLFPWSYIFVGQNVSQSIPKLLRYRISGNTCASKTACTAVCVRQFLRLFKSRHYHRCNHHLGNTVSGIYNKKLYQNYFSTQPSFLRDNRRLPRLHNWQV